MASSLELRSTLLDFILIEFSSKGLSSKYKILDNIGKYILWQILKNYISENLINRLKMGFIIPISKWYRERLNNWMLDTLHLNKIKSQNILNFQPVGKMIKNYIISKRNCHHEIWNILIFQMWFDKWIKEYSC